MTSFRNWPSDGGPHTSESIGAALAGLIRRDSNGLPVPGVLGVLTVEAVPASWKVEISPFTYVAAVGSGIQLTGLSSAEQVDISPATGIPADQGRIDLVCWNAAAGSLVVIEGTVAAVSVAPSAGGLAPVATVRVNSGEGMVVPARVAPAFVVTSLVSGKSERRTVPLSLSGAVGSAGGSSWRSFVAVQFATPFAAAPHLEATAVFPSASVQIMQIISVTATGFTGRVIRIAHTQPLAGSVTYTATEK